MPKLILILLSFSLLAGCATQPKKMRYAMKTKHLRTITPLTNRKHPTAATLCNTCNFSTILTKQSENQSFDKVYASLTDLPTEYQYKGSTANPWKTAGSGKGMQQMMIKMFKEWCTALPEIKGGQTTPLIQFYILLGCITRTLRVRILFKDAILCLRAAHWKPDRPFFPNGMKNT